MASGDERGRHGGVLRLVVALLVTVLLGEVFLRSVEGRLSGNLAHVAQIPEIVAGTGNAEQPAVLLLGNSLTNNGMSAASLQSMAPGLYFGKVTPDATGLWDWQCIVRNEVLKQEVPSMRVVVIGFAWHLLSDDAAADPSRLGALFCRFGDLRRPGSIGLSGSPDVGEFVAARALHLYALRDTVRNQLFVRTIPHYRQFVTDGNVVRAGGSTTSSGTHAYAYSVLAGLAEELKDKGVLLVLVAMPVQTPYEIDPALKEMATRGELQLFDYRSLQGISRDSFLDSMHLGTDGSEVLSRRLAQDLVRLGIAR
jgi:hypothetical protein